MRLPFRRARTSDDGARRALPRKDRRGASPAAVGLIALVLITAATFFAFTKKVPFTEGFKVNAVFESANSIRARSPVRIAGVNVGTVTAVEQYEDTDMAVVEMEIQDSGLPIHKDATMKIRPRIFLEGNFFVDLQPGTPGAPTVEDGDTIRVTQTAVPVQLDQVLTALQSDTREDLKTLLSEFGRALDGDPAESDRGQDASVRGETAGESLNDTYRAAAPALRSAAIVQDALRGEREDDLSSAIRGLQRTTAALGRNERVLQDLVVNFNRTMDIFADEKADVSATIRELAPTLPQADRAFASLNRAFPSTRAFAREILPGVRETGPTIDASFPWIAQVRRLVGPDELQGLARDLQPASRDLAVATDAALEFFPEQDALAKCLDRVILPTGDVVIREPEGRKQFETGVENYKEFFYGMTGLAGEGQNFDGNGQYVRFQAGGGSQTFSTGQTNTGSRGFFTLASPPVGTRPRFPGKRPPYRPDQPCYRQTPPDLNAAVVGPPDGGQGSATDPSRPGGSSGDDTTLIPQVPGVPPVSVPSLPGVSTPGARTARRGAKRKSVAAQLVERLNPYRKVTPKQRRAR